jgi:glycosyltransferase involved in cell wall biosynthesis
LNQAYNNYEIIVSDNYSQDNTYEVVRSFHDTKLKYVNTGRRMSMSENFDFALSHVKDGYVIFIGDDDGVVPNSLEYVNDIINQTGVEAVTSHNAFYTWPGTPNPNQLFWSAKSGYEIRDSKEWIKKYLTFKMVYTFELPGAYCGFVKREVFDRVLKDGFFFRSPTPDAYSAIAVAFATDKYVYSHTAFAVHGASARSNGGSFLNQKKGEEKQEAICFLKENSIPFHRDIVFTKAFRISSLEAYLQFSDTFPELTKDYHIDWKLFLSYVLTERQENTKEEIEEAVQKMCEMHGVDFKEVMASLPSKNSIRGLSIGEILEKVISKVIRIIFRKKTSIINTTEYGVYNVHDAMLLLKFYLK